MLEGFVENRNIKAWSAILIRLRPPWVLSGAVAVNIGLGGTDSDMRPAIEFFKQLHANQPIVPKQTSYARAVSGEIPILFDYDFNAYRAKYGESGNFELRISAGALQARFYVTSYRCSRGLAAKAEKVPDGFWIKVRHGSSPAVLPGRPSCRGIDGKFCR